MTLTPKQIVKRVADQLDDVFPKTSWGETSLFYNPGRALPNGVYFCTIKEQDGENDRASDLNRDGVFRVAIGIGAAAYVEHFGDRPARPAKGQAVDTGDDFTELDRLMPHPVYAWMGWAQLLNPSAQTFEHCWPLIEQAHALAREKFAKRIASAKNSSS